MSNEFEQIAQKSNMTALLYRLCTNFIKHDGTLVDVTDMIERINELNNNEVTKLFACQFSHFIVADENKLRLTKNISYFATRVASINFTNEQKRGIKQILSYIATNNTNTFGLYGFAGTGKTTVLVELMSYLVEHKYIKTIVFTAPTNKAVNVMKHKFRPHLQKITENVLNTKLSDNFNFEDQLEFLEQRGMVIHFMTIHKLLMYQTEYSLTGEMIFVRNAKHDSLIDGYEVVVIDECSMINTELLDVIFEEITKMKKKYVYTKVIFSGDPAQLPPVNEDDSCIFCPKHSVNTVLLKQVVRSRINNVTEVCHKFRKWIGAEKIPNLSKNMNKEGVHLYDCSLCKTNKVGSDWFNSFIENIKQNGQAIILTWTNRQSDQYNETIRKLVFNSEHVKKFEIGDILMLSDFYNLDRGSDFITQKLYTSEQIRVIDTMIANIPINKFENVFSTKLKKLKIFKKLEADLNMLVPALNAKYCGDDVVFTSWVMKVVKLGDDQDHFMNIVVVDDVDSNRYNMIKVESSNVIRNFVKQIMNQNLKFQKQIEFHVVRPIWKQWHSVFTDPFASVNYGYSITCHKAQGSNFYDVYVDLEDIMQNSKTIEAKKCAYTAVTRTSNELHILA